MSTPHIFLRALENIKTHLFLSLIHSPGSPFSSLSVHNQQFYIMGTGSEVSPRHGTSLGWFCPENGAALQIVRQLSSGALDLGLFQQRLHLDNVDSHIVQD